MRPCSRRSPRPSGRAAGFTLIELLVGITGGLFVTMAVFLLAKQTTDSFREQSRSNEATTAAVVGFDRLQSDIARAGYLSTPNIRQDPKFCGAGAALPAPASDLASVVVHPAASPVPAVLADNGRAPDVLVLSGAFTTSDQFPISSVNQAGTMQLDMGSAAIARTGVLQKTWKNPQKAARLAEIFPKNHLLRLIDTAGSIHFATVTGITALGVISFSTTAPTVTFRAGSAAGCGLRSFGAGSLVNPVSIIRYSIVGDTRLQSLFYTYTQPFATRHLDTTTRTALIREPLAATNGAPIAGDAEVVAEYAVDLKVGLTVAETPAPGADPTLTSIGIHNPAVFDWAGKDSLGVPNRGPQRVRAVRARLSVRAREVSHVTGIRQSPTPDLALYRFGLGPGRTEPFARVRTLQSNVTLRNQLRSNW